MTPRATHPARRGASLIEAVAVVLVLAIAVPPTISMALDSANRRADAMSIMRATALASAVMDQVLCDACATDVGASPATYIDAAVTGLRARLSPVTSAYTDLGMTYSLAVSGRFDHSLTASGDPARDVYRSVEVTVTFVDSRGVTRSIPVTTVVTLP